LPGGPDLPHIPAINSTVADITTFSSLVAFDSCVDPVCMQMKVKATSQLKKNHQT
jgi:hypothetical protein